MLDATILRGENKDEATRSILNVVPTKNDDGASYRCTVWNRALRQEHSLEAGTKVFVNCKYFSNFYQKSLSNAHAILKHPTVHQNFSVA